jgi:hypothetical protein
MRAIGHGFLAVSWLVMLNLLLDLVFILDEAGLATIPYPPRPRSFTVIMHAFNLEEPISSGYPAQPGYTCFAWAGGTFFTVVLLCQFLVLVGNRFWFYILMYLEYLVYDTVVRLC